MSSASNSSQTKKKWSTYGEPLEALECWLSGATEIGWWSSGRRRQNRYLTAKQLRRLVANIKDGTYDRA